MNSPTSFEFSVRYRLGEYLRFTMEHGFATEQDLYCLTGAKRHFVRGCMKALYTAAFLYKSLRVGKCHFRIGPEGIRRRSKGGEGTLAWENVKAIHRYSPVNLIEMQRGALPIPFRVLSSDQMRAFQIFSGAAADPVPAPV